MSDWPQGMTVRPAKTWASRRTPDHERRHDPFRGPGGRQVGLSQTLTELERELRAIAAVDVVLEVPIPDEPANWRRDGRPRAHARPDHPGVQLRLKATGIDGHPQITIATDQFTTWQSNLRAIMKTLEDLRRMDRYGTFRRGNQYEGLKALPAGDAHQRVQHGRQLIADAGGAREAQRRHHPDAGGDAEDFKAVRAAIDAGYA